MLVTAREDSAESLIIHRMPMLSNHKNTLVGAEFLFSDSLTDPHGNSEEHTLLR